ncbi:hypothetical protein AB1207_17815 [Kineococcus endophyticus]|uniref:DNA topoisomerase (ATP-hydrolyzing) n=1 Tax=Kineococcus endophyticus TaxID=1181883 RepID=A0ABV3PAH8_9ACTN
MERERIEWRLALVEAQLAAADRAQEVTAAVLAAEDREGASRAVAELLAISQEGGRTVLDTAWGRLTQEERRLLAEEAARMRRQLGSA